MVLLAWKLGSLESNQQDDLFVFQPAAAVTGKYGEESNFQSSPVPARAFCDTWGRGYLASDLSHIWASEAVREDV